MISGLGSFHSGAETFLLGFHKFSSEIVEKSCAADFGGGQAEDIFVTTSTKNFSS